MPPREGFELFNIVLQGIFLYISSIEKSSSNFLGTSSKNLSVNFLAVAISTGISSLQSGLNTFNSFIASSKDLELSMISATNFPLCALPVLSTA